MDFLGICWLALLVVDLTRGLSPFLYTVFQIIWGLFVVDFLLEFIIAPRKLAYLKRNWLTALSLAVPALRVFRVFRAAAVLRLAVVAKGARLVSVLGSIRRGMHALGSSLGKRGFAYVLLLTLLVSLAGAAGMYSFEKDSNRVFDSYGSALWWTAMIMTTMGSGEWPETVEGRILCFLLALYSFTIFGYITAALASFFVGQDREGNRTGTSPPDDKGTTEN
jgi:voltage-gated potassium channel